MVAGARHARGALHDQAECGGGSSQEETYEAVRELKHDAYINTDSLLLVSLLHNGAIFCAKTRRG